MMNTLGGQQVLEMIQRKKTRESNKNMSEEKEAKAQEQATADRQPSRFIISPGNYWNMQWNNTIQVIFVIYIFMAPILIVESKHVSVSNIKLLLVFDVLFVIDRIMDLFVGFIQPNGQPEYRLYAVVLNNISVKFFLEIFITVAPIALQNVYHRKSVIYALFKVVRYVRLFEIDGQVADILEYYA